MEASEPEKKIEQVTVNPVIQRKKSLGRRFMDTFFQGATAKGVVQYVVVEVIVPATKDLVFDAFQQGLERTLFGDARSNTRRSGWRPTTTGSFVNYNKMSGPTGPSRYSRSEDPQRPAPRSNATFEIEELVLRTRPEANMLLDRMVQTIKRYGTVSINDLYDMLGLSTPYTNDKFGWTALVPNENCGIRSVRGGYVLELPNPEPLN